MECDAMLTGK